MDNSCALENHIEKCRVCLQKIDSEDHIKISSTQEYHFLLVTQMELEMSNSLSNIICCDCCAMLKMFADFKLKTIELQQSLLDFVGSGKYSNSTSMAFEEVDIKVEPVEPKVEPVELKDCYVQLERLSPKMLNELLPSRVNYRNILAQLNEFESNESVIEEYLKIRRRYRKHKKIRKYRRRKALHQPKNTSLEMVRHSNSDLILTKLKHPLIKSNVSLFTEILLRSLQLHFADEKVSSISSFQFSCREISFR